VALKGVLSLVLFVYLLTSLGIVPSLGPLITRGAQLMLQWSLIGGIDWTSVGLVRDVVALWFALPPATREMLLFAGILGTLIAALVVVAVLYMTWTVCWRGAFQSQRRGGT
jgi:hypothetical protein